MINFYPGPSKIYEQYPAIAQEILQNGLASFNHRSNEFCDGYRLSVDLLKQKLELPKGYEVVFLSSATECWETVCQSFKDKNSLFIYNGAFGKKWARQGELLMTETENLEFYSDESFSDFIHKDSILSDNISYELICYVQNETSNGTRINIDEQKKIRSKYPNALIAVDATSSLGAEKLAYDDIDICFASVQKCMGMPAGLAVMILSPNAISTLNNRTTSGYYNDLTNILENHNKNQTTHTPNTLSILGIGQLYQTLPTVSEIESDIVKRKELFEKIIEQSNAFSFLVKEKHLRSNTVFCLTHKEPSLQIKLAIEEGLILGKGYGNWKNNTLRIANFPAHTNQDYSTLINFIKQCK